MAAGFSDLDVSDRYLPKNTIVVMPKMATSNRSALWLVFWGVGLAMGLILRSLIDGSSELPPEQQAAAAISGPSGANGVTRPMPTLEVNVNAVLHLPTATSTSTPHPTEPATTLTPSINDCGAAEPGKLCQVPFPPQPTATAYPSCLRMESLEPGSFCMWPTESPTGHYSLTGH